MLFGRLPLYSVYCGRSPIYCGLSPTLRRAKRAKNRLGTGLLLAFGGRFLALRITTAAPRRCGTVFRSGAHLWATVHECCTPVLFLQTMYYHRIARERGQELCKNSFKSRPWALKYSHVALNLKGRVSIVFFFFKHAINSENSFAVISIKVILTQDKHAK